MTDPQETSKNDAAPMDFSPFDPLANLEAVTEAIKTLRYLSWSYAGDIARSVIKIGSTFCAGRCVLCVCAEGGGIEIYEYTDGVQEPLKQYFESSCGQQLLSGCLELAPECLALAAQEGEELLPDQSCALELIGFPDHVTVPEALKRPASYVFPLRHQYEKRHVVKPGLLLMQEPSGLARWNRRFLDSVVVVAQYLAMVIECERLYGLVRAAQSQSQD